VIHVFVVQFGFQELVLLSYLFFVAHVPAFVDEKDEVLSSGEPHKRPSEGFCEFTR
jgi:hypothetical protein